MSIMKNTSKIILSLSAIVFLAAGCGARPAGQQSGNSNQQVGSQQSVNSNQQSATQTPAETTQPRPVGQMQTKDNAGKPDYTPGFVIVTETVEGSNLNHQYDKVKDGATAFDLLNNTHQVTAKDYGAGMGKMVLSIDGIAPDSQHFWEFFINGKPSNVGASSYALKDGDAIEWKLSAISGSGY